MKARLVAAAFASGGGTNFQALLDHQRPDGSWGIGLLVTNRAEAGAVARAEAAGVPVRVIQTKDREDADVEHDTLAALAEYDIGIVLLCGYLRRLPGGVVSSYRRRILNVHPALLPAFGGQGMYGMNVHRAVLEAGVLITGPTVHWVDDAYDSGRIVAQWPVPVMVGDTPEAVAERVLAAEHRLYPEAVDHVCGALIEGREPTPLPLPDTIRFPWDPPTMEENRT